MLKGKRLVCMGFLGALVLTGCGAPAPMTEAEIQQNTIMYVIGMECARTGRVHDMAGTVSYADAHAKAVRSRSTPAQQAAVQARLQKVARPFTDQECRDLAVLVSRYTAAKAQKAQDDAAGAKAMSDFARTAQQMNQQAAMSRPRMTSCQYHQWGGTAFCNSY